MTNVQIIILCTVIVAWCVCYINIKTKKLMDKLYRQVMGIEERDDTKPKSPYSLIRNQNDSGSWGYCITKNGEIYRLSPNKAAPVYNNAKSALFDMNLYEKAEGYSLTELD